MLDWIYQRVCLRALFVLVAALGVLSMFFSPPAYAAQTRTFTITKPTGYFDGTPFGTEQLVSSTSSTTPQTTSSSSARPVLSRNEPIYPTAPPASTCDLVCSMSTHKP